MSKKIWSKGLVVVALSLAAVCSAQSVDTTVSIDEYNRLKRAEDSVNVQLIRLRAQYREMPQRQDSIAPFIIEAEKALAQIGVRVSEMSKSISNVVAADVLRDNQPNSGQVFGAEQRTSYRAAVVAEARANGAFAAIATNYTQRAAIAAKYNDKRISQHQSDSLYDAYTALLTKSDSLVKVLGSAWSIAYDNKSYLIDYMCDYLQDETLRDENRARSLAASAAVASAWGKYDVDAVTDYVIRKSALLKSEVAAASRYGETTRRDSLTQTLRKWNPDAYKLKELAVNKKVWIDYQPIKFSKTVSVALPGKLYDEGVVYRVLLGSFTSKQNPARFKGISPLYVFKDGSRYIYVAGGYARFAAAKSSLASVRARGFSKPEVVRWHDGHYENIALDKVSFYAVSVVVNGTSDDSVQGLIEAYKSQYEVSKLPKGFLVKYIDSVDEAATLAKIIAEADKSVSTAVVKME